MPSCTPPAHLLLTLILCCLVDALRADSSTTGGDGTDSILASLTTVALVAYTDRITSLPLNDITLAYRLIDSTTTIDASMGSVATNLAAMHDGDIDFATSADTLTVAHSDDCSRFSDLLLLSVPFSFLCCLCMPGRPTI